MFVLAVHNLPNHVLATIVKVLRIIFFVIWSRLLYYLVFLNLLVYFSIFIEIYAVFCEQRVARYSCKTHASSAIDDENLRKEILEFWCDDLCSIALDYFLQLEATMTFPIHIEE